MTPRDRITAARNAIDAREGEIKAWAHLDWDAVEAQVQTVEAIPEDRRGPLWGMPVGVKDIFDTVDFPTSEGSPIYADNRPSTDAACVAVLRAAGAIILGKTVTTELAYFTQNGTRHPMNSAHSPGGSSSGSAAAVAAGMVPLAVGSQTAGSVCRPASFCGVVGFKPSHGLIPLAGTKSFSPSLDTAGVFARSVADVAAMAGVMTRNDWQGTPAEQPPRIARFGGPEREAATPVALAAVDAALDGLTVGEANRAAAFSDLIDLQLRIMRFEMRRESEWEVQTAFDQLSPAYQQLMRDGEAITAATYAQDCATLLKAKAAIDDLFGDAEILVQPSAPGEAPLYEDGTGDPVMNRAFTLLGLPAISIPCGTGPAGLPLGLQLAARPHRDKSLLRVAAWFERRLAGSTA